MLSAVTVLLGGVGFLLAWFAKTYVLDPITKQRETIGEIDFTLIDIARSLEADPWLFGLLHGEEGVAVRREAGAVLRRLGARLRATTAAIRFYRLLRATAARRAAPQCAGGG